jgi:hypothetical protein
MIRFLLALVVSLLYSCKEDARSVELVRLTNGTIVYSINGYWESESFEFKSDNDQVSSKMIAFRSLKEENSYPIRMECRNDDIVIIYPKGYYIDSDEFRLQLLVDSIDGKRVKVLYIDNEKEFFRMLDSSKGRGVSFRDSSVILPSKKDMPIHCQ